MKGIAAFLSPEVVKRIKLFNVCKMGSETKDVPNKCGFLKSLIDLF